MRLGALAKLLLPSTIRWTSASDGCTAICSCVSIVSDKQKSRVESLTVDAIFVLRYRPRRRQEHKLAHRGRWRRTFASNGDVDVYDM